MLTGSDIQFEVEDELDGRLLEEEIKMMKDRKEGE
jgi:hypothetical protein